MAQARNRRQTAAAYISKPSFVKTLDAERDRGKARVTAVVGVSELLDIDRSIILQDADSGQRDVPICSFAASAVITEAVADYAEIEKGMDVE